MKKFYKNKMCRVLCLMLALAITCSMTQVAFASERMNAFTVSDTYTDGYFSDINKGDWFYGDVVSAYEYGIAKGSADNKFLPYDLVSVSEVIAFGARIMSIYNSDGESFVSDGEWYEPYVSYAVKNGIIRDGDEILSYLKKPATRAQTAYVLANSLPFTELSNINTSINSIPDVAVSDSYYNEIIMLYRAGVLSGKDEYGTFSPTENVTRAETAAAINRIINPSSRLSITLKQKDTQSAGEQYDAERVSQAASPSVFYIELYDKNGKATASGSGFFIDTDGTAVTNYHVINDAYSAKIVTVTGSVYDVKSVLGYDKKNDLAILKIDGSGFNALELADSDNAKNGQHIFCIGSPLGLDNSITEGVISNTSRTIDGQEYIQISAPISSGSSGGAVLDTNSRVIGVSAAGIEKGQNINLAIPSNRINEVARDKNITLEEFQSSKSSASVPSYPSGTGSTGANSNVFYSDNTNVPNYGYLTGEAELQNLYDEDSKMMFRAYRLDTAGLMYYTRVLQSGGFSLAGQQSGGGRRLDIVYSNGNTAIVIRADMQNRLLIIGYYI